MTIRDIAVAFGIEVDQKSVSAAENAIKGVKNMASKLLGAIGIGFSIAGIANLAEAAADAEALKSQFSQVFGDLEQRYLVEQKIVLMVLQQAQRINYCQYGKLFSMLCQRFGMLYMKPEVLYSMLLRL